MILAAADLAMIGAHTAPALLDRGEDVRATGTPAETSRPSAPTGCGPDDPYPDITCLTTDTGFTPAFEVTTGVADHVAWLADPRRQPSQEMITMLEPDLRRVLDGTSIAHLASVLPDGGPHSVPVWIGTHGDHVAVLTGPGSRKARNLRRDPRVALSLTPADNPYQPVVIRGRVVEWLDGDAGWEIVDRIATKYIGGPYSRDEERVVALIEPDRQSVG